MRRKYRIALTVEDYRTVSEGMKLYMAKDTSSSDPDGGANLPRVRLSILERIFSHHARQPNHESPPSELPTDCSKLHLLVACEQAISIASLAFGKCCKAGGLVSVKVFLRRVCICERSSSEKRMTNI